MPSKARSKSPAFAAIDDIHEAEIQGQVKPENHRNAKAYGFDSNSVYFQTSSRVSELGTVKEEQGLHDLECTAISDDEDAKSVVSVYLSESDDGELSDHAVDNKTISQQPEMLFMARDRAEKKKRTVDPPLKRPFTPPKPSFHPEDRKVLDKFPWIRAITTDVWDQTEEGEGPKLTNYENVSPRAGDNRSPRRVKSNVKRSASFSKFTSNKLASSRDVFEMGNPNVDTDTKKEAMKEPYLATKERLRAVMRKHAKDKLKTNGSKENESPRLKSHRQLSFIDDLHKTTNKTPASLGHANSVHKTKIERHRSNTVDTKRTVIKKAEERTKFQTRDQTRNVNKVGSKPPPSTSNRRNSILSSASSSTYQQGRDVYLDQNLAAGEEIVNVPAQYKHQMEKVSLKLNDMNDPSKHKTLSISYASSTLKGHKGRIISADICRYYKNKEAATHRLVGETEKRLSTMYKKREEFERRLEAEEALRLELQEAEEEARRRRQKFDKHEHRKKLVGHKEYLVLVTDKTSNRKRNIQRRTDSILPSEKVELSNNASVYSKTTVV